MKSPLRPIFQAAGFLVCLCGTALVGAGLVWLTLRVKTTPPITQNRVEERLSLLTNARSASSQVVEFYAWQDTDKGFVRLPIERAKVLTVEEWKNPAAARSNLMARAAVLLAPPPPPPPSTNR